MDTLEHFVVITYGRSSPTCNVNIARLDAFDQKQTIYNASPPAQVALKQHVKQAIFQVGHVWGQTSVTVQQLPSPLCEAEAEQCVGF